VRNAGLERSVAIIVHGFATALVLARETDLVATVPERHTAGLRKGMYVFPLPLAVPTFTLSMLWHPRLDGDLAHRWLRRHVKKICADNRLPDMETQPS
jgi:DNA-binding transcriptional LysR family regulator